MISLLLSSHIFGPLLDLSTLFQIEILDNKYLNVQQWYLPVSLEIKNTSKQQTITNLSPGSAFPTSVTCRVKLQWWIFNCCSLSSATHALCSTSLSFLCTVIAVSIFLYPSLQRLPHFVLLQLLTYGALSSL